MKILLVAVNAKFTHMNPAVYSIRACAGEYAGYMEIAEYTINQYARDVLSDIYEKNPDVIGFSCYIWNIRFIGELLEDIKKVLPDAAVFLGGPEVSYNPGEVLGKFPSADGIFCGEGELPWKDAAEQFAKHGKLIRSVPGLVLRNTPAKAGPGDLSSGRLHPVHTETGSLDQLPFIFNDLSVFDNRMLYYETSRGCPFRCTYCISSIEKHMRFRSLGKVYPELQFFLDHRVRIVKFIDRTFNADHDHAMGIWKYLAEHDNGVTRFHFEIEADILTDDELDFLCSVRPGLFQLEIGVQSANPRTLKEIRRNADILRIREAVKRLTSGQSEHMPVHVDLIAGLPFEDLESFRQSFNEVFSWGADELQLGFLKVLHGTVMEQKAGEYGLVYGTEAPYEVMSTKWLSYSDIILLKEVEDQLERYANSGAFRHTLRAMVRLYDTPFDMFESVAEYYRLHAGRFRRQSRISAYEMLRDIIRLKVMGDEVKTELFDGLMILDLYEKEKLKARPDFLGDDRKRRQRERDFIRSRGLEGNMHTEFFRYDILAFERDGCIIPEEHTAVFRYDEQQGVSLEYI